VASKTVRASRAAMRADEIESLPSGWRNAFLASLAETSHVRRACKEAKVGPSTVYDLRRRDASFRARWMEALAEGYDNLEMELLHSLRHGDAEGAAKLNHAVAFRMLQQHRENVLREKARRANVDASTVRASIDRKVAEMRALVLAEKLMIENKSSGLSDDADGN
jgi:hypothetical protein